MRHKRALAAFIGIAILGCGISIVTRDTARAVDSAVPIRDDTLLVSESGIWHTVVRSGKTLGDTLRAAQFSWTDDDVLVPPADTDIAVVSTAFLTHRRPVRVQIGTAAARTVRVFSANVEDILAEAGIPLASLDRVTPRRGTTVNTDTLIAITRVEEATVTETVSVPPTVNVQTDASLALGKEIVEEPGEEGITENTFRVRTENGEEVSRVLLSAKVVRKPTAKHVRRGTKIIIVGTESGRASWYATRSGTTAHRTLPFGTRLRVTRTDTGASTIVEVADRGPYIDGRVVDLSSDAFKTLAPLGTGTIPVRVDQLQ